MALQLSGDGAGVSDLRLEGPEGSRYSAYESCGISVIGGAGTDSLAVIDPVNQQITSFGNLLLQGGSGPNADALINATGPQSVISQNGTITLLGGSGPGADALIITTSPFQTVNGAGGVFVLTGPAGGGIAGFQRGQETGDLASTSVASELLREQEQLDWLLEEGRTRENEEEFKRRRAQLCS